MNIGIIIVITVIGLWALGAFIGVIGGLSKPFSHTSAGIDSSSVKTQEEQTIQDTQEKQQKLMDDMKQKMQDMKQQQKF